MDGALHVMTIAGNETAEDRGIQYHRPTELVSSGHSVNQRLRCAGHRAPETPQTVRLLDRRRRDIKRWARRRPNCVRRSHRRAVVLVTIGDDQQPLDEVASIDSLGGR